MNTLCLNISAAGGVIPRLKGIVRSVTFICGDAGGAQASLVLGSGAVGAFPGSSVVGGATLLGPMIAGHTFEALSAVEWHHATYEVNQPIDVNSLLTLAGSGVSSYVIVEIS